jgi:glucokinase
VSDYIIGVDLGGTNLRTAAVSRDREILARAARPTQAERGPEGVMENIQAAIEEVLGKSHLRRQELLAVGIGCPGPLNWQTGIVYETPNLPGWDHVPLADEMAKRVGVPCYVDNDANAACYGEFWLGAGQGTQSLCMLTLGTGVGGGMVVFGQLLRGIDGTAAELGHIKVQRDGRLCGCGARGCLEPYASVTGLVQTAREGVESGRPSMLGKLCGGDYDQLTGTMIHDALTRGDALAKHAMEETGIWLGLGISSLINLQNPEMVILYGGMTAAGDALLQPVRRTARENSFEVPAKRAQIVLAALGPDAGVIGAAGCALVRTAQ